LPHSWLQLRPKDSVPEKCLHPIVNRTLRRCT
jgi:hypothetical protein